MQGENIQELKKDFPNLSDITLEKIHLFDKLKNDEATALELVKLSFLCDMITAKEYDEYLEIEKEYGFPE